MRKYLSISLIIVIVATILSGCGGGGSAAATKVVCTGLTGLDTVIASVGTLSSETSVNDVLAVKARIDPIVAPLRKAAATIKNPTLDQIVVAYDSFDKTISSLPKDAKLGEASAAITNSMNMIKSATAPLMTTLKCAE